MTHEGLVLLEIGGVVLLLAFLARLGSRLSLPTVPFYLLAGLAFGDGGSCPWTPRGGSSSSAARSG